MICPKCGFEQSEANLECRRCGLIFGKMRIEWEDVVIDDAEDDEIDEVSMDFINAYQAVRRRFFPYYWIGQGLIYTGIAAIIVIRLVTGSIPFSVLYFFIPMAVAGLGTTYAGAVITRYRCPACDSIIKRKNRNKMGSVIAIHVYRCPKCCIRLKVRESFMDKFSELTHFLP